MRRESGRECRVAALVPMRHDSERVPGKNYRPFAGRPLYCWVLEMLSGCRAINEIVVDTDSSAIRDGCSREYPHVRVLERPPALRDGSTPMNAVLMHDVTQVVADVYVQTHSTNPLLRSVTVSGAVKRFLEASDEHDSLFSVTRRHVRLWDSTGRPLNHDPAHLLRTQDLPPVYEENSCLFVFSRGGFLARQNRIGARPLLFEVDPLEAWDIDNENDFLLAEMIHSSGVLAEG